MASRGVQSCPYPRGCVVGIFFLPCEITILSLEARFMSRIKVILTYSGCLLIVIFCLWWGATIWQGKMVIGEHTWITHPMLGADFWSQVDMAARLLKANVDPYQNRDHLFHYPPLAFDLFVWTPFFKIKTAMFIWMGILTLVAGLGAWFAYLTRKRLKLESIPFVFILAVILLSFPVMFAIERANYDLLIVLIILIALELIRSGIRFSEFVAGCLLAVAPWIKIYPGLMGLGFLALRWWRVLGGFVFMGVVIGLVELENNIKFVNNMGIQLSRMENFATFSSPSYMPWLHSLPRVWFQSTRSFGLDGLAQVPGTVVAVLLLSPPLAWVCIQVYRCRLAKELAYPLLLWINALATFLPAIANDYNLVYLPICAASVWRVSDPWYVQIGLALLLLWWQPFSLPINSYVLFLIKFAGLITVGICIARRAKELPNREVEKTPKRHQSLMAECASGDQIGPS